MTVNTQYCDIIRQFMFEAVPSVPVDPEIRFEAISKEVFGTKQRRNGPMPKPEVQVAIRDILRNSGDVIDFFLPWGSRKQVAGMDLDILDFMALKQLRALQEGLQRYGKQARFTFRLEDLTDQYLFRYHEHKQQTCDQIQKYLTSFQALAHAMLEGPKVSLESDAATASKFMEMAEENRRVIYRYLTGEVGPERLDRIGWVGGIPNAQRKYYEEVYSVFYPGQDTAEEMARYFASTLARKQLKAQMFPREDGMFIFIYFGNPTPASPVHRNRLYYRSIPERFTHKHYAPWIGKGYVVITEDNCVIPKAVGVGDYGSLNLVPTTIEFGGSSIQCDYLLAEETENANA